MDAAGTFFCTTNSNDVTALLDPHTLSEDRTSYNICIVGLMGSGKSVSYTHLHEITDYTATVTEDVLLGPAVSQPDADDSITVPYHI